MVLVDEGARARARGGREGGRGGGMCAGGGGTSR